MKIYFVSAFAPFLINNLPLTPKARSRLAVAVDIVLKKEIYSFLENSLLNTESLNKESRSLGSCGLGLKLSKKTSNDSKTVPNENSMKAVDSPELSALSSAL